MRRPTASSAKDSTPPNQPSAEHVWYLYDAGTGTTGTMSSGDRTDADARSADGATQKAAREVLNGSAHGGRLRRLLPFLGPAFIAAVAYVDPGNFATNIQGGARFGYLLLWVIFASNAM